MEYNDLVSFNTYAVMRGVTQNTVRVWATAGKVPTVKIDGRYFVKLTEEEVKARNKKARR